MENRMFFKSLPTLFVIGCCVLILPLGTASMACVGKKLSVGTLDNTEDRLLAEFLVLIISERTGTAVEKKLFQDIKQLYKAMASTEEGQRIDIMVEDTEDAAAIVNFAPNDDPGRDYDLAKKRYKKDLLIIWLEPFGMTVRNGKQGPTVTAPLLRQDVLLNFPLLPRVLNKLADVLDDKTFAGLLARAERGDELKNIARDFLMAKKLI